MSSACAVGCDDAAPPVVRRYPKDVLCYACALRMSMLFNFPPPRTLSQLPPPPPPPPALPEACASTAVGGHDVQRPMLDDAHHPLFTVVHETAESARRYFAGALPPPLLLPSGSAVVGASGTEVAAAAKEGSTAYGMLAGDAAPRYVVSWLCTACMGLYQFMDLVHAPLAAAEVRASPYFDSAAITVNVNVNRSFTFVWLAVATRYFDVRGSGVEAPAATAIVKEELSNFKDFYMSDLRARILPYLLHPHDAVVASAAAPSAIGRSSVLPGIAVYVAAVAAAVAGDGDEEGEGVGEGEAVPVAKRARVEGAVRRRLCALQGFRYSGGSESVVGEVFCRHHATEALITAGHLPAAFCGNRSTEVLPYSVVYDYALPYLVASGWLPAAGERDRRAVARAAATVSCHLQHANILLMGNYCKMMRNMSQSPWFLNGQRIGSYSLQEVIANPVLPFFFPDMPALPPDAQRECSGVGCGVGGGGGEAEAGGGVRVERGAHASRWQAVAPSVASSSLVFGHSRYKFHSAGREDVDVRMLGEGRPFVLELVSPQRERFTDDDLRRLGAEINASYVGSVEVSGLRRTDAEVTVRLARHSESKVKRYRCVVWSSRAIVDVATDPHVVAMHATRDLVIAQRTPLRVLHRRSLHPRPRVIHSMRLRALNAHWFLLDLETQAGTYVKEFVHGDMGRTTPHLGMLLNARTDIIQLDVVGMAMQDLDSA